MGINFVCAKCNVDDNVYKVKLSIINSKRSNNAKLQISFICNLCKAKNGKKHITRFAPRIDSEHVFIPYIDRTRTTGGRDYFTDEQLIFIHKNLKFDHKKENYNCNAIHCDNDDLLCIKKTFVDIIFVLNGGNIEEITKEFYEKI